MKRKAINLQAFYCLFATLIFVCLPHINHLPLWCLLFIGITIALKANALIRGKIHIPQWIVVIMTVAAVTGILLEYSRLFGRNAGITLLVVMLFLKLLETRTYRDGMLLASMMCFLVITNFLFEQRILMGFYMLVAVVAITHAFIKLNEIDKPNKIDWPIYAGKITLMSLPCMVIFFFVFPRIPGPLWELPVDHKSARTGLSDTMSFGNIGLLALSNEPAFRVEFAGTQPPQQDLYWRGIVMENFDGETWSENKANIPAPDYTSSGNSYEYTITLEPHNKKWLFALEMPVNTSSITGTQYNNRYQLTNLEEITQLKRYSLRSQTKFVIDAQLDEESRRLNLYLPDNINPKSRQFAHSLRNSSANDLDVIQKVLNFFRQEAFYYSLRPALLTGERIDQFLFSTRKGFCEHYAGSFVFLMRAAGIPARVVTGYQGGENNAFDDYMIVKQADAHAWTEVWLPNVGWRRIDPTAAVSPSRIEQNVDNALDSAENPRFTLTYDNSILRSMRFALDSINHNWNQWVIAYDRQKQNQLFKNLGLNYNKSNAVIGLTLFLLVLFSVLYYFILHDKNKKQRKEVHQKLYYQFIKLLESHGIKKLTHENAIQFSERAITKLPYLKNQIFSVTQNYNKAEYNNQLDTNIIDLLKKDIKTLSKILNK